MAHTAFAKPVLTAILLTSSSIAMAQARLPLPPVPDYGQTIPTPGTVTGSNRASEKERYSVSTMAEAVARAYRSNPRILAQRATLRSTDELYPAARAAYGPTVNVTLSHTYTRDRYPDLAAPLTYQGAASTASLAVSQPVLSMGRRAASEDSARAQIEYQREQLRVIEQQVMLSVVTSYASVLRDTRAVQIARQNLGLLQQQLREESDRYRLREITLTDLQQVQVRAQIQAGQVVAAEGQLAASRFQFLSDVGVYPENLAPPSSLEIPVRKLDDAYPIADAESPALRAALAKERVAQATTASAKAEFNPRVDLSGNASRLTSTSYNEKPSILRYQGGVSVTIPLYTAGLHQAQWQGAREAEQADHQAVDTAMRTAHASVASAWSAFEAAGLSASYYATAEKIANEALSGARLQQKAGARTTLEVLDQTRDLLSAQHSLNVATASEYIAKATLLAALGRLSASKLVPDIDSYDPEAHFNSVKHAGDMPIITPVLSKLDGLFR